MPTLGEGIVQAEVAQRMDTEGSRGKKTKKRVSNSYLYQLEKGNVKEPVAEHFVWAVRSLRGLLSRANETGWIRSSFFKSTGFSH